MEVRNKDKLKSITNRNMMEEVFTEIEKMGFTVVDKDYADGYMADTERDIICDFHILEIPGFAFSLWNTQFNQGDILKQIQESGIGWTWANSLEIDPRSDLVFFTQYERDIDKFKPSRSGFVWGIYRDAWEEENDKGEMVLVEKWRLLDGIEAILKYMKKHHFKAIEYSGRQTRYIWEDDITGLYAFRQYIHDWGYVLRHKFIKYLKHRHIIKKAKQLVKSLTLSYGVVVEKESNWSPRVDILIRRKEIDINNVDKEQYKKEQDKIDTFEDKYFMEVSVEQFDIDILENYTEKDIKVDVDSFEQFKEYLSNIGKIDEDGELDERKIVYKNYKGELK